MKETSFREQNFCSIFSKKEKKERDSFWCCTSSGFTCVTYREEDHHCRRRRRAKNDEAASLAFHFFSQFATEDDDDEIERRRIFAYGITFSSFFNNSRFLLRLTDGIRKRETKETNDDLPCAKQCEFCLNKCQKILQGTHTERGKT